MCDEFDSHLQALVASPPAVVNIGGHRRARSAEYATRVWGRRETAERGSGLYRFGYPALVPAVRVATQDDLDRILPLWRELEAVQGPFRSYPIVADAETRISAAFLDAIDGPDADILIAFDADDPIGMALVRLDHPSRMSDEVAAELMRVVVRSDRRGTGAGRALVDAAQAWARRKGVRTLVAAIFVANEPSCRFWRAVGFEPWVERMVRDVSR